MKTFSVHVPPDAIGDEAAERTVFVKEGFSWPALFVPALWLLWHRHWLVLLGYLVAAGLLVALGTRIGDPASAAVAVTFAIWFAFEANNLRRWALERRDWSEVGAAWGRNRAEAEIRYFGARDLARSAPVPPPAPAPVPATTSGLAVRPPDPPEPGFALFRETDR